LKIFFKGILGGLTAVSLVWVLIVAVKTWRWHALTKPRGITGLGASDGVSTLLLHTPAVVVLLAIAFGLGLYLAVR